MSTFQYLCIIAAFIGIAFAAALGVTLTWPWLYAENFRLRWWEVSLIWLAEGAAILWFLYFCIRFTVTGDIESSFAEKVMSEWPVQLVALLVLLAAVVDVGATFMLESQDEDLREQATKGTAKVTRTELYSMPDGKYFTAFAWLEVQDKKQQYPAFFYGPSARFPKSVREPILRERLPADMPILYDPKLPRRIWTTERGDSRWSGWRLSLEVTGGALVFTLLMVVVKQALFTIPIPLEVCPLIGATLRLLLSGLQMWANGHTHLPPFS